MAVLLDEELPELQIIGLVELALEMLVPVVADVYHGLVPLSMASIGTVYPLPDPMASPG